MAQVGRQVKERMIQELTDKLKQRANFFVASLGLLQAVQADTLRKQLRTVRAEVVVSKRTLGARGVLSLQLSEVGPLCTGSVAFVLSSGDVVQVAKLIVEFAKANEDKLKVRGGWVDGQLLDHQRVEELAKLPSKPQLIAQLIAQVESPLASLVWAIEGLFGELAWVIEEAGKSRPAAAAAAAESSAAAPTAPAATPPTAATPPSPSGESASPEGTAA